MEAIEFTIALIMLLFHIWLLWDLRPPIFKYSPDLINDQGEVNAPPYSGVWDQYWFEDGKSDEQMRNDFLRLVLVTKDHPWHNIVCVCYAALLFYYLFWLIPSTVAIAWSLVYLCL